MAVKFLSRSRLPLTQRFPQTAALLSAPAPFRIAAFTLITAFCLFAPPFVALTVTRFPTFAFATTLLLALLIAVLRPSGTLRRYFLLVALITTMSGQVGLYFGHSLLSTFLIEDILCLTLSLLILLYILSRKAVSPPISIPILCLGLYCAATIASTIYLLFQTEPYPLLSLWHHLALSEYRKPLLTATTAFTLSLAAFVLHRSTQQAYATVATLLIGACVLCFIALIEYIYPEPYYRIYHYLFGYGDITVIRVQRALIHHRAFSVFDNGPGFAAWLVPFAPIAFHGLVSQHRLLSRIMYAFAFLFIMVGIYVTGSRAPAVALVLVLLLYPWFLGHLKAGIRASVAVAVLAYFLLSLSPFLAKTLPQNNLFERFLAPREGHLMATLEKRYEVWQEAAERFRESPLLGIGPDQFWARKRSREIPDPTRLDSAHSGYVQTLAELGLVGAVTGGLLVIVTVVWGIVVLRSVSGEPIRGLAAALLCGCCGIFITGLTEPAFTLSRNFYVFCIFLGLLVRIQYLQEPKTTPRDRIRGKRLLSATSLAAPSGFRSRGKKFPDA